MAMAYYVACRRSGTRCRRLSSRAVGQRLEGLTDSQTTSGIRMLNVEELVCEGVEIQGVWKTNKVG